MTMMTTGRTTTMTEARNVNSNDPLVAIIYSMLGVMNAGEVSKIVQRAAESAGKEVRYPDGDLMGLAENYAARIKRAGGAKDE